MNSIQYADVETSTAGYASRFAGPTGQWLLSVQSYLFLEQLSSLWVESSEPITLLDAGGGHGQIVEAIAGSKFQSQCKVTVLGSSKACQERLEPFIAAGKCTFQTGDMLTLPFADQSFDVVTSFRFIPHCDEWNRHIAELCRVARRAVIVDYPTYLSVNCLSPLLFQLKMTIEKNTRTYALFSNTEIAAAFEAANFQVVERTGEFFLPMALHRALKDPKLSARLEFPFASTGITRMLGSPMIVRAVPRKSHG